MALEESFAKELEVAVDQAVAASSETPAASSDDTASLANAKVEVAEPDAKEVAEPNVEETKSETTTDATHTEDKPEEKPADSGTPAVPALSDTALTQAVQHGISIEDARLFPSDEALLRAVKAVQQSVSRLVPKEKEKEADKPAEEDLFATIPKLDETQYEPEVVKMFDAVVGVVKKQQEQLKALRQQTEQSQMASAQAQQAAVHREMTEWFDGQVAKLGDDFKEVLGVGGTDALPSTSPQRAKRNAIANQAAVLLAGYNATGQTDVDRDSVFKAAAAIVLAEDYAKLAANKLTSNLQKRGKQHIQRAGGNQKQKSGGDPYAETVAALRQKFPKLA